MYHVFNFDLLILNEIICCKTIDVRKDEPWKRRELEFFYTRTHNKWKRRDQFISSEIGFWEFKGRRKSTWKFTFTVTVNCVFLNDWYYKETLTKSYDCIKITLNVLFLFLTGSKGLINYVNRISLQPNHSLKINLIFYHK